MAHHEFGSHGIDKADSMEPFLQPLAQLFSTRSWCRQRLECECLVEITTLAPWNEPQGQEAMEFCLIG